MSSGGSAGKQRGGEMPKDPAENQDQYKIQGGFLNEYELEQNKGVYEESAQQASDEAPVEGLRGAAEPGLPQNVAERIRQVEERAHEIVERRRAKQGGGAPEGASKKGAGKAAAKKSAKAGAKKPAKGAAKKSVKGAGAVGSKKAAGKKGAAKSGGAKKGAAKAASKKGGAAGSSKKGGAAKKGGG